MKPTKFLAVLLTAVMACVSLCCSASAETVAFASNEQVLPAYQYAQSVKSLISVSSSTAECTSMCLSDLDVVSITIEQTLEKHSGWFWIWNNVDGANWVSTRYSSSYTVVNSKSGLTSGTYRLKSVFTLTDSSGQTETITVYSDEVTIS